jgi:hypothetical protein
MLTRSIAERCEAPSCEMLQWLRSRSCRLELHWSQVGVIPDQACDGHGLGVPEVVVLNIQFSKVVVANHSPGEEAGYGVPAEIGEVRE